MLLNLFYHEVITKHKMNGKIYNKPITLLSNKDIQEIISEAIREERKNKKEANKKKQIITPYKFFNSNIFNRDGRHR